MIKERKGLNPYFAKKAERLYYFHNGSCSQLRGKPSEYGVTDG